MLCDGFNGIVAVTEQLFGIGDFFCQQILDDRCSEFFFELPGKIVLADIELVGKLIEGDIFGIVFVEIAKNILKLDGQKFLRRRSGKTLRCTVRW